MAKKQNAPTQQIRRGSAATAKKPEPSLNDIPRWLPPALYALVTVILFRQFLFGGKVLGTDTVALSYFARHFYTSFIHAFHKFPLWDPNLYGGLPFVDGMHGDIFYPPSLALFFMSAERMWGWKMLLHVFVAGIFMYLFLREIGVSRGAALLGGLVFMMGADLVSLVYPGGDGKLFVSALAPLAFMFTERAARNRRVQDYAAFSLVLALVMFTSHMQCAYFLVWGVSAYFIYRIVQLKAYPHIAAFALAGILGVGAAAIQFMPPLGYLREWSHRASKTEQAQIKDAYAYSTSYSLHPEEIMSLVVPEFVGDNVQTETHNSPYWGRNPLKLNSEYAGLLGLVLLPLALLARKARKARLARNAQEAQKAPEGDPHQDAHSAHSALSAHSAQSWFFAAMALLALIYALGADTPFFRLFYMIPGVKLFRAPSIIIFLYGMSVAALAALALDAVAEDRELGRKAIWVVPGILLLLALMAGSGVLINLWQSVIYKGIGPNQAAALQANLPNIKTGFFLAFAIATAFAVAIEGTRWGLWNLRTALIALCAITFLEQLRADAPFIRGTVMMNELGDPSTFQADETINFLKQRQAAGEVFRVFDISLIAQMQNPGYPQNVFAIHGLEQTSGHHGNEMGRYRELLGGEQPLNAFQKGMSVFDVTNTEYIVSPQLIDLPGYTEAFRGSRSVAYRKADVLPRAYLVGATEVVPDDKAVDRLLAQDFNAKNTAIVAEPLTAQLQPNPQGSVQWLNRGANAQQLKVRSDKQALLMVLDNYYPQWRAQIDGKDAPIVRANYTFRGVVVPAGDHDVTFTYVADNLKTAAIVSVVILLTLMVLAFGAPVMAWTRR